MRQKNSPGRKNIRRVNAVYIHKDSLEDLKNSKIDTEDTEEIKKFEKEKIAKIEVVKTIIHNTEVKILDQKAVKELNTKIFRGANN